MLASTPAAMSRLRISPTEGSIPPSVGPAAARGCSGSVGRFENAGRVGRPHGMSATLKNARESGVASGEFAPRTKVTLHDYAREWIERYQGTTVAAPRHASRSSRSTQGTGVPADADASGRLLAARDSPASHPAERPRRAARHLRAWWLARARAMQPPTDTERVEPAPTTPAQLRGDEAELCRRNHCTLVRVVARLITAPDELIDDACHA